jgi:hypothetical protein
MAKKKITPPQLRKPAEPKVANVEQFVSGTSDRSTAQTSGRPAIQRKDGRTLRKMTIYMPVDLAKRLAVHCAAADVDMSDTVVEAVTAHLAAQ